MKKRFLSSLLALCMLMTFIPSVAMATDGEGPLARQVDCTDGDSCTHEAAIGNVHYDTLQEAINSIEFNEETSTLVTLLNDITLESTGISIKGKNITLELNGKTISSTDNALATLYIQPTLSNSRPNTPSIVTIQDTPGTGKITNSNGSAIGNYGDLTITGGTYNGAVALYNMCYTAFDMQGTATIEGGTFEPYQLSDDPLEGTFNSINNCGVLTVTDGTITGILDSSAELTVNGGSIDYLLIKTDVDYRSEGPVFTISNPATVKSSSLIEVDNVTGNQTEFWQRTGKNVPYHNYLSDAIAAAADGATITLHGNYASTETITIDKNLTFDLGGYKITSSAPDHAVTVNGKAFTVKNGTLGSTTGGIFADSNSVVTINSDATIDAVGQAVRGIAYKENVTLNITGTVLANGASGVGVMINGTNSAVNIDGATINCPDGFYCAYINGSAAPNTLSINNSTLTGSPEHLGVYVSNSAEHFSTQGAQTLSIAGSSVTAGTAVDIKFTNATITNSNLTATYSGTPYMRDQASGNCAVGYAFAITNNTVSTENKFDASMGTATINGGKYDGPIGIKEAGDGQTNTAKIEISNGYFTTAPNDDYIAANHYVTDSSEPGYSYMVVPIVNVSGVTVTPTATELVVGSTQQLTAIVSPNTATNKAITWSSSDPTIATVDANGVVTGVAPGTATITVTTADGSFTATCIVTVVRPYVPPISGGGSSSSTTTTTEKNPDGSTTTTVTDKKTGTVTETTKQPDGSSTTVETKKDGTVTETNKTANGTTGTVVTEPDGEISEITAEIPNKAAQSGQTVTLPVEVPVADSALEAPVVEIAMPKHNGGVTVEIPVDDPSAGIVAIRVNPDGTEEIVKTAIVTENGVVLTLTGSADLKIVDNTKEFADVPDGHWAGDAVTFVAARELFQGNGGSFLPDMALTREQLAVMLYRYVGSPDVADTVLTFADANQISDYAQTAMRWAVQNGLMQGSGNRLSPRASADRAQVAQLFKNFMEFMVK